MYNIYYRYNIYIYFQRVVDSDSEDDGPAPKTNGHAKKDDAEDDPFIVSDSDDEGEEEM